MAEKKSFGQRAARAGLLVLGIGAVGLSASYNILFWAGEAHSPAELYGYIAFNLLSDGIKPFLAWYLVRLWHARRFGLWAATAVMLACAVFLSLYSAYGYRARGLAKQQEIAAQAARHRREITQRYHAVKAYGKIVAARPESLQKQLDTASQQVPRRIWKRTASCTDATRRSSINACADVQRLRTALITARKNALALEKYQAARLAFLKLPPEPVVIFSARQQQIAFWIISILLELASSLLITIALADLKAAPAPVKRPPAGASKPKELHWIDAMKAAAADPSIEGIGFDENGLMRAPLARLADVLEVKSPSTASERLQKLENKGLLRRHGKGRALRYELEPA